MQDMQDMFLSKFKKLKQKNKVLFHNAMKESGVGSKKDGADDDTNGEERVPDILIINE